MSLAHPRLLRQPGPVAPLRLEVGRGPARHLRLTLGPGVTLYDGIVRPLAAAGIETAVMTLLAGPWARLTVCTGVPDPSGARVATYAAPELVETALLVSGSATLGRGRDGAALVHAHGAFARADGRAGGGHLVPEGCTVGAAATVALVAATEGFAIRQRHDRETNHFLFAPEERRLG